LIESAVRQSAARLAVDTDGDIGLDIALPTLLGLDL
jgi:hypothetical protein